MSYRSSVGWINEYKKKCTLWLHDGNPKRPHALLTSGLHSSGFFNSRMVISDAPLLRQAAADLLELFAARGGDISYIDRMVGPQSGGTKLAEYASDDIATNSHPCEWASPEKCGEGKNKTMVLDDHINRVYAGERVLLCDDVLTTGESIDLTARAVVNVGGVVLPHVIVLVNRSGFSELNGRQILALIDNHMPSWTADECPLCETGSVALRPKGAENWELLNKSY